MITNLSDYVLSDIEKEALLKGLNFCIPPPKLKSGSYLSNFELLYGELNLKLLFNGYEEEKLFFRKSLGEIAFSSMFNYNSNHHQLRNLPKEQMDALRLISKNKDIIITKPDKGSRIVILNRTDYIEKVEAILSDTNKFKLSPNIDFYKISHKIERKVRNFLLNSLKKPGLISEQEYKRLYPNGSFIGILYGLPKVNKSGTPIRPICSAVGTATYQLGKFVAKIIKPAAKNSLWTDLCNTFQFVTDIRQQELEKAYMVSIDVKSLFTNIPLNKTIKFCLDRLYRGDKNCKPSIPEKTLIRSTVTALCF